MAIGIGTESSGYTGSGIGGSGSNRTTRHHRLRMHAAALYALRVLVDTSKVGRGSLPSSITPSHPNPTQHLALHHPTALLHTTQPPQHTLPAHSCLGLTDLVRAALVGIFQALNTPTSRLPPSLVSTSPGTSPPQRQPRPPPRTGPNRGRTAAHAAVRTTVTFATVGVDTMVLPSSGELHVEEALVQKSRSEAFSQALQVCYSRRAPPAPLPSSHHPPHPTN